MRVTRPFALIRCLCAFVFFASACSTAFAGYVVVRSFAGGTADPAFAYSKGMALIGSQLYYVRSNALRRGNVDFTGSQALHTFNGGTNGEFAVGPLHSDGTSLFGATFVGGAGDGGLVYAIDLDGSDYRVLANVSSMGGRQPVGGVTLRGSTLYGNTFSGGLANNGVLFSVNTDGTNAHRIFEFTNGMGARPENGLFLSGSTLYGSLPDSQVDTNSGTIFRVDGNDNVSTVYTAISPIVGPELLSVIGDTILAGMFTSPNNFTLNTNGQGVQTVALPHRFLTPFAGRLYGTTSTGGSFNGGTLFSLAPNGSGFRLEHSFGGPGDGKEPMLGLMSAGDAVLYGSTRLGGSSNAGAIFIFGPTVPEPSTVVLAGVGAVALLVMAARRRRIAAPCP